MATRDEQLLKAVRLLRNGGVVGAATETFFGILADLRKEGMGRRIARIKETDITKPIPVIIPTEQFLTLLVTDIPNIAHHLMKEFWPGPLSIVFRARKVVPPYIKSTSGTIAIRVPGPSDARDILEMFGGPLTSTSLNIHRQTPAITARHAKESLGDRLDYIVPGTAPGGLPSTIIDVTVTPPRLVRRGKVKIPGRFLR